MKELIQQIDGWQDMTAEQIRAALIASDPVRRPASESTYNAQDLLGTIDPDAVETLMAALRGAKYHVTANAIESTEGLDFGHPAMQGKLDVIGETIAAFTQPMVDALKSLGVDSRSKWQRANGDATEPTLADVQAGLEAIDMLANYRTVHSAHIIPLLDGDNKTTADLVAAFRAAADALEAM